MLEVSATPILDLEQPVPAAVRRLSGIWIGILIGLGVVAFDILRDLGVLPSWRTPDVNIWLLYPILYMAIAIHELGHAVVGRLAGLDMGGISVGPALWHKSGDRWVLTWVWTLWGGGLFKPLTGATGLDPAPFVWSVAGGPLASLGLSALSLLFWTRCGDGGWSWIGTLLLVSVLTSAISLIPLTAGVQKTDGARLWQFLRHREQARPLMALLGIQTEESLGVRPREWNPALFEEMMRTSQTSPENPWTRYLAFYRALDEGSENEALAYLEAALAGSAREGKLVRHALFQEAACASALVRKNAANARGWRERARRGRKPESLHVVDGAVAMCEGRHEEAIGHFQAARARMDRKRLDSGLIRFAKERWSAWESACASAKVAGAA